MPLVLAIDDIKPDQVRRKGTPGNLDKIHTDFFKVSSDMPDSPSVFLVESVPGRFSSAHFHVVDQFQLIVDGKGKFGRHEVSPYCIHFSRAYTPYGPILADQQAGLSFLALRTRYDPEAHCLFDKLKQIPDRQPWQITKKIAFPPLSHDISLQDVDQIKDAQGLYACALTMAPRTLATTPDPSGGDGQFVVVLKGSLSYDAREHKALTVVFIKPLEGAFQIHAGAQGLEGLILNFPQVKPRSVVPNTPSTAAGFKKWKCVLCAFAYDEALGINEDGIPAGTLWKDVPETWSCPDCSAGKSEFHMVEV